MGVKDLWSVLTPYAERKPISELRGKTVAIDLAGWVCESLNVVDYFVHPRHHLKNLFFRTCYLIWEEVTPIFILEGVAPELKQKVIEKRNELQFRGVKPKESKRQGDKGRTRFNHVLRQCENLLRAMGIQCMQGPGEAEAYCAFLNLKGLVDGVISQDSDCFAYGALRVYRNFSVSSQGALSAQGGAVDIYDMNNICSKFDFGQNKVVVMALLCGCDYCPEGVGGVGRDSVLKFFKRYNNDEILKRVRSWRCEDDKYSALEMRVDDKTICSNCGHFGRTQSHTKNGCGVCRTNHGCNEHLWKEERALLKAELALRKKALSDPSFPSEEIIEEYLKQPNEVPKLQIRWNQPNMVKFIKEIGNLMQWPEIYSFQKFFPIVTRWQIVNTIHVKQLCSPVSLVTPKTIIKKRFVKGVPCLEIFWEDENEIFKHLIPDIQLKEFLEKNPKGLQTIWSTVEPLDKVKSAYPILVDLFLKTKEESKKTSIKCAKTGLKYPKNSLENINDLIKSTNEIGESIKPKRKGKASSGIQMIDKFFKQKNNLTKECQKQESPSIANYKQCQQQCSTPLTKNIPSDFESDVDEDVFNLSHIVNDIVSRSHRSLFLASHQGKQLRYETVSHDNSPLLSETKAFAKITNRSVDDFDISMGKRPLSASFKFDNNELKRMSLDDSFDVLVKIGNCRSLKYNKIVKGNHVSNLVDQFMSEKDYLEEEKNVSFFFNNSFQLGNEDGFEKVMGENMLSV